MVRGEIKVEFPRGKNFRRERGARFDLLILDHSGEIICSVEVKDNAKVISHSKKKHYEELVGKPNFLIAGIEQARDAVRIVKQGLKI